MDCVFQRAEELDPLGRREILVTNRQELPYMVISRDTR